MELTPRLCFIIFRFVLCVFSTLAGLPGRLAQALCPRRQKEQPPAEPLRTHPKIQRGAEATQRNLQLLSGERDNNNHAFVI